MHAKVGVANARDNGNFTTKSSSASVLSQLSKLALGSTCFILALAAGNVGLKSAKQALFADALSVSPKLLSWTGDIHPALKPSPVVGSAQLPQAGTFSDAYSEEISNQVQKGLERIARLAKTEHAHQIAARRVSHHRNNIVLASVVHSRPTMSSIIPSSDDQVRTSQSAVLVTQPARLELAQAAPQTEAEKLQGVQALLVGRFIVAMNESKTQTTQIAKADPVDTQIDTVLAHMRSARAAAHPALKRKPALVVEKAPLQDGEDGDDDLDQLQETEVAAVSLPAAGEAQSVSSDSVFKLGKVATQIGLPSDSQTTAIQTANVYPPKVPLVLNNLPGQTKQIQDAPAVLVASNDSTTSAVITSASQSQSAVAQMALAGGSSLWKNGYPSQQQIGYSGQLGMNTQVTPIKNVVANQATQIKGSSVVTDKIGSSSSAPVMMASAQSRPALAPLLDRTSRWAFHEAFDWNTSVTDPKVEILSHEGPLPDQAPSQGQSLGWRIAQAPQHWATLFWSTPNQDEVPMLNALSAKMLSVKASANLQTDAGIILAKVPAGWTLELSGRAERPLVFDRSNHILAASATEGTTGGERYFAFLNASPGEQILYLNRAGETGALAIPVLGGVMAYADLTQIAKKTVSGRILEASENSPHGVSGIHIQVVGSGMSAVTDGTGSFHIDNVITFGDQSLYLETETQKSFPHRYKLSPNATTRLSLFHLNESQVHEWISQLEGGVSSESGLILGALPSLAASQEDKKPYVGTRSLSNNPTLTPETYTLSGSGQLMVKTPLNAVRSRFISVQVPEGPTLVEVVDKDNRLIWSEITVISPRVLTIVGPY